MQFIAHAMEAIRKEKEGGKCEEWRLGEGKECMETERKECRGW
jgi:hypothetical protein